MCLCLALAASAVWVAQGAWADSVQQKLDKARAEEDAAKQALSDAEDHLSKVLEAYEQLKLELDQAAQDVVAGQAAQQDLSTQLVDAQERLTQRVTTAYEFGQAAAIDMFLGAQSTEDFASVQVYVGNTFQVDDSTVSEVTGLQQSIAELAAQRQAQQQDLAASVVAVLSQAEQAEVERADAAKVAKAAGVQVTQLEKEEQALEDARAAAAAALTSFLGSGGIGEGCASGDVHDLIVEAFTSLGPDQVQTALAVATRESNCRPNAYNPTEVPPYGNASGVFQILSPGIWEAWSERCGLAGTSPFDPQANVAVAACVVADEGWWPWGF
jgi:peptidoglycan hydrolase CwlO-like protein